MCMYITTIPVLMYRRSDFDCEILLIANCEFFHNSQSKESQVKEYAMNNITRDHAPSAQARAQMRSRSRSLTFPAYTGSLDVEIKMNLRQYFESTVNLPTPSQAKLLPTLSNIKDPAETL